MSGLFSLRTLLSSVVLLAAATLSSPLLAQHGHGGGGHGGGGHGFGGHGGGGHGFGGHGGGGHGFGGYGGGHSYGGHYGGYYGTGGHSYGVHGGLHGYAHYGYAHANAGHDYGHYDYGHGGSLYGYGHHDYYAHSLYQRYPYYYDHYPYYGWYPTLGVSLYPWYGFYGVPDRVSERLARRAIAVLSEQDGQQPAPASAEQPQTTVSPPTVTAQGREYQRRAESAFRSGRYGEAVRWANHALVEMPRDGKLLLFISHALYAAGDYRGAAAIHQAATMLDQADWGTIVKNYRKYYRGKAYVETMTRLNKFVKKNPDAAYAYFLRGYHHGFLGHEQFARKELSKAMELEGRDRLAAELLKMFGGEPPANASSELPVEEAPADDNPDHDHGSHGETPVTF